MWTKTKTLLTLSEWAGIIGVSPYTLSQVGQPANQISRVLGQCQTPIFQSGSNTADQLGREEIAQAIQDAERLVSKLLNTFPAPTQRSEVLAYPRPGNLEYGQLWYGASARLKSVRTDFGRIIATGEYSETLIDDAVPVVGSDPYSDGFNTLFTASVTVPAGTTADEIAVYFSSGDIPANLTREDCEIRPITVTISGNTATIAGSMVLLIKVANYLKLVPQELDATTAGIYATTIDVYRRTIDPAQSGNLIFENLWWDGCDGVDAPCTYELTTGCFKATDPVQGWVAPVPAEYDATEAEFTRLFPDTVFAPDRVELNYVCGYARENGKMQRPLAQIVAYLATALLPARTCGCDRADQRIYYYREFPKDDDNNYEVIPQYVASANQWFGVSGRGAIRAASLLMQENLHVYRTVTA